MLNCKLLVIYYNNEQAHFVKIMKLILYLNN
jgi:hypothetical protein